ncbi:MAG: hypothetical protein ACK5YR_16465 [Pirellula sp.]
MDVKEMTFNFAKNKMMTIWGGYEDMHRILKPIHFLYLHMYPAKFLWSLDYLIAQGLVAEKFIEFYKTDCKSSDLELQKYLLQKVDKESKAVLYAGKDVVI